MGGYTNTEDKRGQAAVAATAMNGASAARTPSIGTGFDQVDVAGTGESFVNGAFGAGDWLLHHGGQLVLDGAGFIPGVNVVTEGIQAGYHALHAGWDAHEDDAQGVRTEIGEAGWHAGLAVLNVVTGEGGKAAEGAKGAEAAAEGANSAKTASEGASAAATGARGAEAATTVAHAMQAAEDREFALHALHFLADTSEVAWDVTATMAQLFSGDSEKLPFLGGLVPWIANGAGREEGHPSQAKSTR